MRMSRNASRGRARNCKFYSTPRSSSATLAQAADAEKRHIGSLSSACTLEHGRVAFAPLTASDIMRDNATGVTIIAITEDETRGTRLKTLSSRRVVPVHPALVRLGFLRVVEECRASSGASAPLFPLLARTARRLRGRLVEMVWAIHSQRRAFTPIQIASFIRSGTALRTPRAAGVSEDVNDALTGHSGGGVGRTYGAKDVVRR